MINNTFEPGCKYDELPDSPDLLSRQLKEQNYRTGYTGKWRLGSGSDETGFESGSSPTL